MCTVLTVLSTRQVVWTAVYSFNTSQSEPRSVPDISHRSPHRAVRHTFRFTTMALFKRKAFESIIQPISLPVVAGMMAYRRSVG